MNVIHTSACANSLSWCGNLRSTPPVCISRDEPQISLAIAEHSICQPGLPSPHGESQNGSPGFDFFHNAKSVGFFLLSPDAWSPKKLHEKKY